MYVMTPAAQMSTLRPYLQYKEAMGNVRKPSKGLKLNCMLHSLYDKEEIVTMLVAKTDPVSAMISGAT